MKTDVYSKIVQTVIALCLIALLIQNQLSQPKPLSCAQPLAVNNIVDAPKNSPVATQSSHQTTTDSNPPLNPESTPVSPPPVALPSGVKALAIKTLNDCGKFISIRFNDPENLDKFKVLGYRQAEMSDADFQNGITEKWTIKLSYLAQHSNSDPWRDMENSFMISKINGVYGILSIMDKTGFLTHRTMGEAEFYSQPRQSIATITRGTTPEENKLAKECLKNFINF